MADLLSTFANAYPHDPNAFWRGAEGIQNMMGRSLELQQKREALEAERGLRALYQQNPNPSFEDVARYSPEFAMKQQNAMMDYQGKAFGMQKTQREISGMEAKTIAETLGPIAERAMMSGDVERYKREMGQAASALSQQGINLPMNFDPEQHTPDMVLQNAVGRGYKSPFMENQMAMQRESAMRQLPPAMSPQQFYGGVEMGPYGPRRVPGIANGMPGAQYGVTPFNPNAGQMQQGPVPGGMQQAPLGANDLAILKQNRAQMPESPERDALDRMIAEVETGQIAQPPAGGFVTPQQEMQMRIGEKAAEASAVEVAKSTATKRELAEQRTDVLGSLPPEEQLNALIDASIGSGAENILKGKIAPFLGQSTPALEATKQLEVIQPQLQSLTKALVGAGAVSDYEQKMMANAAASIANPEMPPEPRKAALKVFMDIVKKAMTKYPDLAQRLQAQPQESMPAPTPSKLTIGTVKDGYEYVGGNPNDKSSWKKVR